MKRFLLWIISVALGVALLLAAVMGVSYAFTTQGGCPDAAAQFGGQELETNGFCWQVPLLGGRLDKVFASPATLTVQKLGTLYTAHPDITLPDWASYTTLTIQTAVGSVVFAGSVSEYQSFLFPANGEYKAEMTLWRVPKGGMATQFEGGSTGALRKNLGLERPAKPTGWYRYSFRFTLQASADIAFSAERVEQGGIVGVRISGMTGDTAPAVETDLGSVQCVRAADGWRAYIPAAYNASSGGHAVNVAVNGEPMKGVKAINKIEAIGSAWAIGRDTHVGDTLVGIKGRVGFEAAAPMLIIKSHELLEKHTLTKWQQYWKDQLGTWYGMFMHEAMYSEPVMRDIEKFLDNSQRYVTGKVFLTLRPYTFSLVGIESKHDLMNAKFAEYGEINNAWTADDVKGFTKILSMPLKIYHAVNDEE